jgi:hypothetical protein
MFDPTSGPGLAPIERLAVLTLPLQGDTPLQLWTMFVTIVHADWHLAPVATPTGRVIVLRFSVAAQPCLSTTGAVSTQMISDHTA